MSLQSTSHLTRDERNALALASLKASQTPTAPVKEKKASKAKQAAKDAAAPTPVVAPAPKQANRLYPNLPEGAYILLTERGQATRFKHEGALVTHSMTKPNGNAVYCPAYDLRGSRKGGGLFVAFSTNVSPEEALKKLGSVRGKRNASLRHAGRKEVTEWATAPCDPGLEVKLEAVMQADREAGL